MKNTLVFLLSFIFGRNIFFNLNLKFYKLTLYGIGYNNFLKNKRINGELKFILSHLKKKKIKYCIDVGANIGEYSKTLLMNSNSYVVAFEPQINCNDDLNLIKKEFNGRFNFFNIALGEKVKKTNFYFSREKSELSSVDNVSSKIHYIDKKKFIKKKIIIDTLDNILIKELKKKLGKKNIDFIKIDTEGYELEVLKGAKKILKQFKPNYIQVELNWHHLFKGYNLWIIYEFISQFANYKVYKILPNSSTPIEIDPSKPEHNLFNYSNYIFKKI